MAQHRRYIIIRFAHLSHLQQQREAQLLLLQTQNSLFSTGYMSLYSSCKRPRLKSTSPRINVCSFTNIYNQAGSFLNSIKESASKNLLQHLVCAVCQFINTASFLFLYSKAQVKNCLHNVISAHSRNTATFDG